MQIYMGNSFKNVNEARNVIVHNTANKNIKSYETIIKRLESGIIIFEKYLES